ncbi:hypothetical protein [uncultured Methanolobus sp.]|uniref:hypothetical protein n=1 Tax=uncultured Methanolobus sp. TaxID=218300 RepID=UPI002AAAEBF4|nr:hypothetical protein [uncultured Methanolobus sp.]
MPQRMIQSFELILTLTSAGTEVLKDIINVAKEIHSIRISTITRGPFGREGSSFTLSSKQEEKVEAKDLSNGYTDCRTSTI